ncbi:hypothetical protein OEIGOIKO_04442 [Streptomyces chrestomyceticus JCM 4735]|uniref:Uncharacterized protein n=2 Tax=Streptomyces TaxID=1883 RepID=A0A401W5Z7_STREY|nr:hypothetical protein OEIGOIKO_04442 [Streptomyces chrestomyceticus JCM 4735]GCD44784.1 hypothetical protein GKJPGBOP_04498 [Streptomyces paromomycinus]
MRIRFRCPLEPADFAALGVLTACVVVIAAVLHSF